MRPNATNPLQKRRKKQRRNWLDNSASLNRTTLNRGNIKKKNYC